MIEKRKLASVLLHAKDNNVVYCHVETGCKVALDNLNGANGITKSPWNETYYIANHRLGGVKLLDRQLDDTLALIDEIPTGAFSPLYETTHAC
jgi:arylesterase / paraoxonase